MRLESLSLKLLDLIVLGRQNFTLEEMKAQELFVSIAGSLEPMLEEKMMAFNLDISPACVMVEYDLFKTLVLNLIDNAIKAGCSSIKLVGKPHEELYTVSISDNGRSIPDAELNRVTEAFYMVDKSRSRKQHGAGLGLSLAMKIAEIHGSSLEFDSAEGIGTIVTFQLGIGEL